VRHAILGPGGVGGLTAACLAHLGHTVTVVVRSESLSSYPDRLEVESPFGGFSEAVQRSAVVPEADIVWVTVKATQLAEALRSFPVAVAPPAIVPLLNGIDHLELLRSRYGAQRVVAATFKGETERVAPGRIVHRSPFAHLDLAAAGRQRLESTLTGLQRLGFACRFVDHEPTLMWSKLVFLAPVALTTSAARASCGEVAADPAWRGKLDACVREACAVARAEGATVDAAATLAAILGLPAAMRSSMQKDIERGWEPELDAVAGAILRGAARHGIAAQVTLGLRTAIAQSLVTPTRPQPPLSPG
jgi:2-dehydropantoate 2-reductase